MKTLRQAVAHGLISLAWAALAGAFCDAGVDLVKVALTATLDYRVGLRATVLERRTPLARYSDTGALAQENAVG